MIGWCGEEARSAQRADRPFVPGSGESLDRQERAKKEEGAARIRAEAAGGLNTLCVISARATR